MKNKIAIPQLCKTYRLTNGLRYASSLALALLFVIVAPLRAADVTWNNGAGTSLWNLTDMNWNTGVWNNANGDGAIFDATGAGAINVTSPINVDSLNLIASGYSFNGTGPLTFVNGTSTLGTTGMNQRRYALRRYHQHADQQLGRPRQSRRGDLAPRRADDL